MNMVAQTIGLAFGAISPYIAALPGNVPLFVAASSSILTYSCIICLLPRAGSFLPAHDHDETTVDAPAEFKRV